MEDLLIPIFELPQTAFSMYFSGDVAYVGRAFGSLEDGKFLLLYKNDKSITIHAGIDIPARNYMGAGSSLEIKGNMLLFVHKKEILKIKVNEILWYQPMSNWSENKVQLKRTEQELVNKLFSNWGNYIDGEFEIIEREYPTEYGPVDLVGIETNKTYHVVEAKRRRGTVADCTQLKKYLEAITTSTNLVKGYLASPQISDNAAKYLEKHGHKWIQIDFDI